MTISFETKAQIDSITSEADLRAFARSFSAQATAANAVLYSGMLESGALGGARAGDIAPSIAHQLGWAVIDDTPRAEVLSSRAFINRARQLIIESGVSDPAVIEDRLTNFLYGAELIRWTKSK